MSEFYTQVLAVMYKTSSSNPMSAVEISAKSRIEINQLNDVLQSMFEKRALNRIEITKLGVKEFKYWRTGVAIQGDFTPKRVIETPRRAGFRLEVASTPIPPSFDVIKKPIIEQPNAAKEQPIMTEVKEQVAEVANTDKAKPIALLMLEFMEKTPNCRGGELRRAANAGTVDSYIDRYIKSGVVIKTKSAAHETRYSLAAGLTTLDVYSTTKLKLGRPLVTTDTAAQPILKTAVSALPEAEINPLLVIDEVVEKLPVELEPIKGTEAKQSNFRLAITSDQTLMLFGLQQEVIELSKANTEILLNFVHGITEVKT